MTPYEDIINLPHHISKTHPQMPIKDRASQFSPFAALTGYDDAIDETARLTDGRVELDEEARDILDRKLQYLRNIAPDQPEISVTYFVPDEKKSGGRYITATGCLKRIDEYERVIIMSDGKIISLNEVSDIAGDVFVSDSFDRLA